MEGQILQAEGLACKVPEVGRSKAGVVRTEKGTVRFLGNGAGTCADQVMKNLLDHVKKILLENFFYV